MSSLLEWLEDLESGRSVVVDTLCEKYDNDAWAALSPASLSSPDFYSASSSPTVDNGSPAFAPGQHQGTGSPFPTEGGSPAPGSFTALLADDQEVREGFGDTMDEGTDDILSQYLGNAVGMDAMDVEFPEARYEPLFMPMGLPSTFTASPPHSVGPFGSAPTRLTDADVQWLTTNTAPAPLKPVAPAQIAAPTATNVAVPDTKPKPKAVKDMRVEFYRQEIKRQTYGKHTAGRFRVGDVESRSPFFLSFIWREYVNAKYNIRIPPFRDPTTGMVDTRQMLQQKIRSSRTPWKQIDLDKALKEAHAAGDSMQKPGRYRGDIAYYFKRCLWSIPADDAETLQECVTDSSLVQTADGELAYMEKFEPGDIVAVLSDGSVTKDTTRKDVALISIVPGNDRSLISPWKCLPDPPPQPLEEHVLVAVMGIVQIRVTGTVPERADETYVIVPSGRGDGSGVVLPQSAWAASSSVQPIVALPLSGKEEEEEGLLLAFRSEQINVPWLQRLEEKTARLECTQEKHSVKIEAISSAVEELQQGGHLLPGDPRERLELQQRPRLTAHHTTMAASGQAPCKCLSRVLAVCEESGQSLLDALAERGENIVTVSGHPYSPQYAVTRETGERLHIDNLALVSVGKSCLGVQMMATGLEGASVGGEKENDDTSEETSEEKKSEEKSSHVGLTAADLELLKEGKYSVRINQECSGCEILIEDRFVLRLVKVRRWKDTIQDIVASSAPADKDSLLPQARMCLREFRGKRRRYIGRGRMAKRIAKGLGGSLPTLDHHQRHQKHSRGGTRRDCTGEDSSGKRRSEEELEEGDQLKNTEEDTEQESSERVEPCHGGSTESPSPSTTFIDKVMASPAALLLFCRRLVANTWEREKMKLVLFHLSAAQQELWVERFSSVLMEIIQKEFILCKKTKSSALTRAQGMARKMAVRNPLGYIFWAAHAITAWQVLYASDRKGYDIFGTSVALQALSAASTTSLMCEAISRRPGLMKMLDTFLTKDADISDQCAAMRIYLALCSTESVGKLLGEELNRVIAFAAELLPAGACTGELRAAAFCLLRTLATDARTRQRLYAHKEIQECILLHGYELDCSPRVRKMGEELRQLMAKFPLASLDHGRDIDCNVPFRCKAAKRKGCDSVGLELSHLDLATTGADEKAVAALLRLPVLSSAMLSLERNYFLEFQFKPTTPASEESSNKRKGASRTPGGEELSDGSSWTVLWLHDGRLLACSVASKNTHGCLTSTCRFPPAPGEIDIPADIACKKLVARVNKCGWQEGSLFQASASDGLCLVLLSEVTSAKRAKLSLYLRHVELL